jgi:hypothetical protein
MGFETTIPVSELAEAFNALDGAGAVVDRFRNNGGNESRGVVFDS